MFDMIFHENTHFHVYVKIAIFVKQRKDYFISDGATVSNLGSADQESAVIPPGLFRQVRRHIELIDPFL